MKVLLVNGSPHAQGCVYTALNEAAGAIETEGIQTEIFHIGSGPVQGCTGCYHCMDGNGCVFKDKLYLNLVEKVEACDALIVGAPVYYAAPPGPLCAILDRLFFANANLLKGKFAACTVNCRRGGASAAFDRLNKYFTITRMPVVSSQYWNSTHGMTPDEVKQDLEGLQTMRTLGRDMAYLLKARAESALPLPEQEPRLRTNFIN